MWAPSLPAWPSVVVVCAHPDDESFGLGAVVSSFVEAGSRLGLLCLTHGEASTLHDVAGELHVVRAEELEAASTVLGVDRVALLDYPDGRVAGCDADALADVVAGWSGALAPSGMLVFDEGGITGHADHQAATAAAVRAAAMLGLPVLAWALPNAVAEVLNDEFGTVFVGRRDDELDVACSVDRTRQLEAIHCHRSQSADNPVLWRRLELLGSREHLRYLGRPAR
jgi:LmbE family N-acetylglucosaminyl deacetylase